MAAETSVGALHPSTKPRAAGRRPDQNTNTASTSGRLIGLAGLASFNLIIIATFIAPPLWNAPGTTAPASQVAAYGQHHGGRIIASLLVYSVAMGMFLCFTAGLWAWLREREHPPQALSSIFAFSAVALTVLIMAAFVPAYMLSYRTQPATIAGPLADLTFGLLALSGIPTAVCLGAYAALITRLRCLPTWTAWLATVGALTHILIAASFVSHGAFLSLESSVIVWVPATFFAWILATSAVLLRTRTGRFESSRAHRTRREPAPIG
jgi:hypothetical protein